MRRLHCSWLARLMAVAFVAGDAGARAVTLSLESAAPVSGPNRVVKKPCFSKTTIEIIGVFEKKVSQKSFFNTLLMACPVTVAGATIPFTWNEAAQSLTIGARQGSFPGMLDSRTFRIVWVSPGHGVGVPNTTSPDAAITYTGSAINVSPGP